MIWTQRLRLTRGYAEGRTEVYLNRNDHMGVRKADTALHTPLQSQEWSSRLLALATPPVLSGFSVGNSAILYSAYPHKNDPLLLPSAAPWARVVELPAMIPKALSCRMLVLWIILFWATQLGIFFFVCVCVCSKYHMDVITVYGVNNCLTYPRKSIYSRKG